MAAEYRLTSFEHVVQHLHDGTATTFRDDIDSPENAAYQAWRAAGGVPDPYAVPLDLGLTIAQRLGAK